MKTPVVAAVLAVAACVAQPAFAQSTVSPVGYFYPQEDGYYYPGFHNQRPSHRRIATPDYRYSAVADPRAAARYDGRTVVVEEEYSSRRTTVQDLPRYRIAGGAYLGVPDGVARYVYDNPAPDAYLPYQMRRGVRIPSNVYLRAIPGYGAYSYAYVNGQGVAVENSTRRIAYVSGW